MTPVLSLPPAQWYTAGTKSGSASLPSTSANWACRWSSHVV